ncbi:MAG TPA: translation elongation factor Ts [Vicinamibacteria bacterium]|nr:translation elongation factor Ts [Vicinamibacteria bacterium]
MSITAEVVRQLREETGAGMMDCKSALVETQGDMEKARDVLRKKGLAAAAKKASRAATDGAIAAHIVDGGKAGVIVEVNCETDFVAKTPDFQSLVKEVAAHIAAQAPADVPALLAQPLAGQPERTVGELVQEKIAFIKENIVVRRFARFVQDAGASGIVAAYIHPPAAKVGVLVELAPRTADAPLAALAKDVAMHVAAASPAAALFVSKDEVPAAVLEKEKEIYRAQALASGKPANVVDKIAEGKVKEYYATFCLLDQPYIREPKLTVGQHLDGKAVVKRFTRFRLGEESGAKAE